MTNRPPDWELFRTFAEVARDGSLSGAARRLALSQPTVGRHIDALESALGIVLFTRSPRGLIPTSVALELIPHAEAMGAANAALLRAVSGASTAKDGAVRLAASEIIGFEILPAILADFRNRFPAIDLELALSNRNEDLLQRHADIAVRMMRPTQAALVVQRIGKVRIGVYAHRRYVDAHGLPKTVEECSQHCCIGYDTDDHSFRSVSPATSQFTREMFGFRCDSDQGQLAALRAGIGLGACQVNLAKRDPNLVPVLPNTLIFELDMWLAMHEDLKTTGRVRLLFDHLFDALAKYVSPSNSSEN